MILEDREACLTVCNQLVAFVHLDSMNNGIERECTSFEYAINRVYCVVDQIFDVLEHIIVVKNNLEYPTTVRKVFPIVHIGRARLEAAAGEQQNTKQ